MQTIKVDDGVMKSRNDHATQVHERGETDETLRASLYSQAQTPVVDMSKYLSGRYLASPEEFNSRI